MMSGRSVLSLYHQTILVSLIGFRVEQLPVRGPQTRCWKNLRTKYCQTY